MQTNDVSTTPLARDPLSRRMSAWILAIILIGSFLLKLHHLNHQALKGLDESFHAIVAQNLLEHPLKPVLIERPYLPPADWQSEHIWLHKPIMPLWQVAISFLIFGVNTFALRLPAAILSTAAAWITYAIGRDLVDRTTGLVAAALQAICPAIVMLVHGYVFSDTVDISLLFWTELGIWLILRASPGAERKASRTWLLVILAGIAQGLAFLSKTYPGLIVTGVALVSWILPRTGLARRDSARITFAQFGTLVLVAAAVVAPWMFYIANRFPREFVAEHSMIWAHLHSNIENFAAPWDKVWFEFLVAAMFVFYPPVLVAMVVMIGRAWQERNGRLWILIAWTMGVLVPFTLATSKTPSSTLPAWPAMFLIFGAFVSRGLRDDRFCASALASSLLIAACWLPFTKSMAGVGARSPVDSVRPLGDHLWVIYQALGALGIALILSATLRNTPWRRVGPLLHLTAAIAAIPLLAFTAQRAWKVTEINASRPALIDLGEFVQQHLPENAVLLFDEQVKLERNTAMFRARRTCYDIGKSGWQRLGRAVIANGGEPYVVSARALPLKPIYTDSIDGRTIYQWSEAPISRSTSAP